MFGIGMDGQSPLSMLSEIYSTTVYSEAELKSEIVDKLNALEGIKNFELCKAPPLRNGLNR
jgi:hypothetical protein